MKILKRTCILSLLFFLAVNITAQNASSIIYESATILVTKNAKTNHYQITNKLTKETLQNLKFVKQIEYGNDFQVLSEDKQIFYINENGKISEELDNFFGLCGTVPHYTMSVREDKDALFVYENETFYDQGDEIPAEKIFEISKKEADSILFINGFDQFNFTANFNAFGDALINPRTFFVAKDGKYFDSNNPQEKFDSLDFKNHNFYITTIKNGLHGILGVTAPKYLDISTFNGHLAKAVLPDGREIYIDKEGVEYY